LDTVGVSRRVKDIKISKDDLKSSFKKLKTFFVYNVDEKDKVDGSLSLREELEKGLPRLTVDLASTGVLSVHAGFKRPPDGPVSSRTRNKRSKQLA